MTLRFRSRATKVVPEMKESEDLVGVTHVTVSVRNPADHSRSWQGLFLVDTGATDCMVPASALRGIGLEPEGKRTYQLATGEDIEFDIAVARLEWLGEIVGATVLFGPDDAEPILGVIPLESVGVVVDPKTNELRRLPAVPLK